MATDTGTRMVNLEYVDTIGFVADQGGRGFHLPMGIAIKDDGRIYVASRSNTQSLNIVGIQVVNLKHEFFGQINSYGKGDGQMIWPTALALDSQENLYLSDDFLQRITIFDGEGNFKTKWGAKGNGDGEFDGPSGIVFDSDDNMLLVDHRNNRVQKFTKDGRFISKFGSQGGGDGQFDLPWGICLDDDGYIYIADWRNDRIQKFTSDGEFVAKFGASGDGDGQLNRPAGVAVDSDGNMYVADWGNQRLQVLAPDGSFLLKLRGQATLSHWAKEYLEAQADELKARESFQPVFDVDTDDQHEVSARIEPYFWDPVTVILDKQDRVYVLETSRHRFQVFQKA
ncbi:MAG: hypothetical protein J4O08_06145 [Chloroflexi bacterium]|nr:hypothetical protein [Chloroflexota bacterium]MCI0869280.1 hypothetical protein [Chloroflexota bacterium]